MIPAILGTKIGMTRVHENNGAVTCVSVVQAGPCTVLQVRSAEREGYEAVQLGFRDVKPHRSTKPAIGHAATAGTGPKRYAREIRLTEPTDLSAGDVVTVDIFKDGVAYVDVVGTSKGRGFSGVMRRHGFGGLGASHGVERKHRSPGSIGGHCDKLRGQGVKKGKRMAGQFGNVRRTQRNLRLVGVDSEKGLLLIEGSVPGANGGMVLVCRAKAKKVAR
jgi:large subunit ribosomal protein L3